MATKDARTIALEWIREIEGGLVEHPDDPGGLTKYGLSQRAYPTVDIAGLDWESAARIYVRDYWRASGADLLPDPLAIAVMDGAVNHGRRSRGGWDAAVFLQRALGITADGWIGPQTESAAQSAVSDGDHSEVLIRYLGHRAQYYHDLVRANSSLAAFYRGWMHRLFRLQRLIEGGNP